MKQLSIIDEIELHQIENNSESQAHLNENRERFTKGCNKVLKLLQEGKRLTTINAVQYGILSLARRIKDLRDCNGVEIKDRWLTDENGRRTIKEWYL